MIFKYVLFSNQMNIQEYDIQDSQFPTNGQPDVQIKMSSGTMT